MSPASAGQAGEGRGRRSGDRNDKARTESHERRTFPRIWAFRPLCKAVTFPIIKGALLSGARKKKNAVHTRGTCKRGRLGPGDGTGAQRRRRRHGDRARPPERRRPHRARHHLGAVQSQAGRAARLLQPQSHLPRPRRAQPQERQPRPCGPLRHRLHRGQLAGHGSVGNAARSLRAHPRRFLRRQPDARQHPAADHLHGPCAESGRCAAFRRRQPHRHPRHGQHVGRRLPRRRPDRRQPEPARIRAPGRARSRRSPRTC